MDCLICRYSIKDIINLLYETISKYAIVSLDSILNEWYWWIFDSLSFDYLVKIMDCFLFEGQKIFYRVSLALAQQFSRYIELIEECELIDEYFFNALRSESLKVDNHSIHQFCQSSANLDSIDKLMKVSFNIRNLKRSTIKEYYSKEENKRKNFTKYDKNHNKALASIENNQKSSPTRIYLNEAMTSVLSHANLCSIWNWIPQRLSICTPNMLFTTQENGTSLNTLFNVLDELEYCLIVIKTFENEIFGAFCAGDWNERKNPKTLFFGTGETFLFTLSPEKSVFKWVGLKQETKSNQEMFIRVNANKISIGGGSREGLVIKSNLLEGETNQCDTFANEPLCRTKKEKLKYIF
ncbi:TBC1 domain family member 24 isoform X4 [Brachionus plicatilis]|uniref:TBC1 domain family member 24 isoform X4 n=1 Tax=Brachionus plicatilis TaxID=10195 RepID=A0A3M7RJ39_BRAPC|nr:TBC1 domain family member 24 isoform X4 [Brachionus plicatilis]